MANVRQGVSHRSHIADRQARDSRLFDGRKLFRYKQLSNDETDRSSGVPIASRAAAGLDHVNAELPRAGT